MRPALLSRAPGVGGRSLPGRLLSGLGVMVVAGSLISGCGGSSSSAASHRSTPSSATSATSSPSDSSAALFPASVGHSQLYTALTPAQQAQVDSDHNMTVGQFEQLPLDQRLAYAQFVYDVYQPGAMAGLKKSEPRQVVPAPETLSDKSSGQDILDSDNIKRSTAFWMLAKNGKMDVINDANRSDAEKMVSLRFTVATGDIYAKAVEDLENLTDLLTTSNDDMGDGYFVATAMEESPTFHATDGTPEKYIHSLGNGGVTDQYREDYHTFKDLQGNDRGQWLIESIVPEGNALWIPADRLAQMH